MLLHPTNQLKFFLFNIGSSSSEQDVGENGNGIDENIESCDNENKENAEIAVNVEKKDDGLFYIS